MFHIVLMLHPSVDFIVFEYIVPQCWLRSLFLLLVLSVQLQYGAIVQHDVHRSRIVILDSKLVAGITTMREFMLGHTRFHIIAVYDCSII